MGTYSVSSQPLVNTLKHKLKMQQNICIFATLLATICQAMPDHHPGVHHHPVHHQVVHHGSAQHAPVHHQTVHHEPVHTDRIHISDHHAPAHHKSVHHASAHHQTVHHEPIHHPTVHHASAHHQTVHNEPINHPNVHHEPVHKKITHQEPEQTYQPTEDVVDIAVGNKDFSTLVKIVSDLGLVETLKSAKAVTILAPNDDAFAKLPAGTLESLTPEQAKEIVLRHVIPAKVTARAISTGPVETIGGEKINVIKHSNGGIQINGPTTKTHVTLANIFATNGVIHVIDSVIL